MKQLKGRNVSVRLDVLMEPGQSSTAVNGQIPSGFLHGRRLPTPALQHLNNNQHENLRTHTKAETEEEVLWLEGLIY